MHGWSWDVMSLAPSVVFFPKLEPCWHLCSCLQVSPWKPPDALDGSASIKTFLVKEFVEIESTWCCGWRSSILSMEPPAVRSLSFDKLALSGLCRQITLVVLSLSCFFSVFLSWWFFLLFFLFRFFFWGESSTSRARADGALATNASWWPASHVHPYMVLDDMTGLSDSFEASMLLSRSTVDFLMAPFLVVHGGCCCCCCWWWWWCCCLLVVLCAVFFCFFLAMHYLPSAWGLCPAGEEMGHARDGLGGCQQRWTGTVHASRNRSCRLS